MTIENKVHLGPLFKEALVYACSEHAFQTRKGTGAPYYSHPMQVAGIALEHGASEEQGAAALLHDVLEDTPRTHQELADEFGTHVADIVRACSDAEDHEAKGDWRERKERYLGHLRSVDADVALVSCADKLHNARSIVMDLRTHGPAFLDEHFKGKRDGTLWYYRTLVETFGSLDVPAALRRELESAVDLMEALA